MSGPASYRTADQTAARITLSIARVPPRTYGIEEMAEMFVDVDAQVVGPEASVYEFHEATGAGAEVSDVFVDSTGQRAHFHLAPSMPASEGASEVRVVFRSTRGEPALIALSPFQIRADRTIEIPSGAITSRGGIYSGPVLHAGQILFGVDPFVHIGATTCDPMRRQGSPERARFRTVGFYTWLDARAEGAVDGAPVATVSAGTIEVQYVDGSRAREARLVYDPRDARGRLVPGRHLIGIRWRVLRKASALRRAEPSEFQDTIHVLVSDDGTIAVGD